MLLNLLLEQITETIKANAPNAVEKQETIDTNITNISVPAELQNAVEARIRKALQEGVFLVKAVNA